ncbi:MAG: nuclear transport factor 2 family protein [Bacteroidetes bacterium]|nr:nuclear transport factor 2 family protein [Bacteroidota bacterium]
MDLKDFITNWLLASNSYDTNAYLKMYHEDAELDDASVGRIFKGHSGIRKYFEDYFIIYKTQTRLVKLNIITPNKVFIEVEFSGEFPEGRIGGAFDFTFKGHKIKSVKASLR